MYTHRLLDLVTYSKTLGLNLYIPISGEEQIKITTWEATGRYDLRFSIRSNTLEKYIRIVNDWYNALYSKGFR